MQFLGDRIACKPNLRVTRRVVVSGALGLGGAALLCAPAAAQSRLGTSRILGVNAGLSVGLKSYPRTLDLAPGEVVLTFDDGPGPQTGRVLDMLRAEGVRATFFLIGRNAQAQPSLVRRMVAEGHCVAHHTLSHPWTLRERSFAAGIAEISAGVAAVETAAYGASGFTTESGAARMPFFRYPGFADRPDLNDWLAARGFTVFGADVWASDWNLMTHEVQLSLVMQRLKAQQSGILLLHDPVPQTVAMLPAFLATLREGGYRIVHLSPGTGATDLREAGRGWRRQA
jgi:peptidoglycan/xylan/chitin deacetylase (PgdA/CDA1 family)